MLPLARNEELTVRELPDETLVYDLQRNKIHCLNRTSALVWRHCDGRTSVTEMTRILQQELGLPPEESLVELALLQLQRRNLLQTPLALATDEKRRSRRLALRHFVKLGAVAAAIPLVMSMTAKPAFAVPMSHACVSPSNSVVTMQIRRRAARAKPGASGPARGGVRASPSTSAVIPPPPGAASPVQRGSAVSVR